MATYHNVHEACVSIQCCQDRMCGVPRVNAYKTTTNPYPKPSICFAWVRSQFRIIMCSRGCEVLAFHSKELFLSMQITLMATW